MGDLNNNMTSTDNYMEKYLPFKIQGQISESFNAVLDRKMLKRFADFEVLKYKALHGVILDDEGMPN